MNAGKTTFMAFNNNKGGVIKTSDGTELEKVNKTSSTLGSGWRALKRTLKSGRLLHGELVTSCHHSLRPSSCVCLQPQWNLYFFMAVSLVICTSLWL